jgi:hypothetical protein
MTVIGTRFALLLTFSLVPGVGMAQARTPETPPRGEASLFIPVALELGVPQGDFAENVDITGGIGGGVIFRLGGGIGLRAELGVNIYGSETRTVPLGNGPLGRITVDVTTTNTIFGGGLGLQLGLPSRKQVRPYVGGTLGFSNFSTTSSVKGTNSGDEDFASSENYSDATFAKSALVGLYIPFGQGKAMFDLGARYTWNGEEVRYLTEGDIVDNPTGPPTITPRRTRADLLTFRLGVTFAPGR